MPKIVYVIGSLEIGGAERHLSRLLPRLLRRGWDVCIYCISKRGVLADDLEAAGVSVYVTPATSRKGAPKIERVLRLMVTVFALACFLMTKRPRIVHFFLPAAYMLGAVSAYISSTRVWIMSRRSLNRYQKARPFLGWLERRLHRGTNAALGNSAAVIAELRGEGIGADKLALIYNGVELANLTSSRPPSEVREELCIPMGALVYTMVGNLKPYKGHMDLLQAFKAVSSELTVPWYLVVVGRDDGIGSQLRETAADLGIADRVRWLGMRKDVTDLFGASDFGVLCSHEEGFSNAILEAMGCGLPMIVTDVGGNAEAVLSGTNGWVVPARRADQLARALLQAARYPHRETMGRACRDRVVTKFSMEACVSEYETIYRRFSRWDGDDGIII